MTRGKPEHIQIVRAHGFEHPRDVELVRPFESPPNAAPKPDGPLEPLAIAVHLNVMSGVLQPLSAVLGPPSGVPVRADEQYAHRPITQRPRAASTARRVPTAAPCGQ